jgi:predicted TIM-barrel fold metal-dependent hydrolase
MMFDAHVHVFRELRGRVAAGPVTALDFGRVQMGDQTIQMLPPLCAAVSFPPEVLIAHMDWAGVDKAMLLQGPFYGNQNPLVLDALRGNPDRLVGAAYLDPWTPDARREFDTLAAAEVFRAVKLEFSEPTGLCGLHPEARLDAPQLAWLWDELEGRGLVVVLDLGGVGSRSYQTTAVRAVAEAHPRLEIVIAHLGQIRPAVVADPDLLRQWHVQIDLGQLPNVSFDTASLVAYCAEEEYPYPSAGEFLRRAIDRIGARRILWGSDIPGLLGQVNYRQLVDLGVRHSRFLSPSEQALFLYGNAAGLYEQEGERS